MKKLCLVCSFCLQDDWKQFMKLQAGRFISIELLYTNVDYQQQTKVNYKPYSRNTATIYNKLT